MVVDPRIKLLGESWVKKYILDRRLCVVTFLFYNWRNGLQKSVIIEIAQVKFVSGIEIAMQPC